jgi:hypothetical protein
MVFVGILVNKRILPGQVVRHRATRPVDDFFDIFTGIQPVAGGIDIQHEVLALDQRLSEINGIGNDADVREMVAMPDEMFGKRGLVAFGQPIAPDPALLDMRGGDG